MKEKTVFALKAVMKLIVVGIYAGLSYDAALFSDISEWVKNPFWKKFWTIGVKVDRKIAATARQLC